MSSSHPVFSLWLCHQSRSLLSQMQLWSCHLCHCDFRVWRWLWAYRYSAFPRILYYATKGEEVSYRVPLQSFQTRDKTHYIPKGQTFIKKNDRGRFCVVLWNLSTLTFCQRLILQNPASPVQMAAIKGIDPGNADQLYAIFSRLRQNTRAKAVLNTRFSSGREWRVRISRYTSWVRHRHAKTGAICSRIKTGSQWQTCLQPGSLGWHPLGTWWQSERWPIKYWLNAAPRLPLPSMIPVTVANAKASFLILSWSPRSAETAVVIRHVGPPMRIPAAKRRNMIVTFVAWGKKWIVMLKENIRDGPVLLHNFDVPWK